MKKLVITGIGPVSSCGIGKEAFWQGITKAQTNLVKEKYFVGKELWDEFYLHKIKDFDIKNFGIDPDKLQDIKDWKEGDEIVDLNYLLASIKLALDDAGLKYGPKNHIGLVLAHENLGLMPFAEKTSNLAYEMLINKTSKDISKKDFFENFYRKFLKAGYDIQTFVDLFHVARVFDAHDYSLFINNACASGLYALEAAAQIIQCGQADKIVIASSDQPDIYKFLWFKELGIYAKDGLIKPFAKDSNGLVFGEAGIAFVMEELESARKRKAQIYAEYCGGGFDLEGYKITIPELGSDSYQKTIQKALSRSAVDKGQVDLVCCHGVGSQVIDYYEAKAVTDTFGLNPKKPLVTAFKPYVGHSLGASALLESAALILSMNNNYVPAVLNCENLDPKFNIPVVTKPQNASINTAMKICCAFAGFNSAAVFKKVSKA
jgi:3-oxoacyl-(acyl-carrier-protein) synthase